ncbi:uncharacterized protein FPRN_00939 [Fusarium proliferatum]|nr:uncharacterized protein FPRN_00939 [Fusarium proliferatum]
MVTRERINKFNEELAFAVDSAGGYGKASRVKINGYTIEEAEFEAIENCDAYCERVAFVYNRERAI